MTEADRIKELEDQIKALKAENPVTIKFGNKRNVVVGGLGQRFPVTLYAPSWVLLLENADRILQFIEDNKDELSWEK